jgi:NAD(P)H-hydrate epimerase
LKSLSRRQLLAFLVPRQLNDHKGVFGHVLIAAGSRGMSGAAVLAGRAALRSGTGLVTLAVPAGIQSLVASQVPEAMTLGLPENSIGTLSPRAVASLKAALRRRRYTTLAIGPGLSTHPDAVRFIRLALAALPLPAVVDADALNALTAPPRRATPCVFTPHPGELARCLGIGRDDVEADRPGRARRLARLWSGTVLLKGHETMVCDGERIIVNRTGGAGLAKGGTGDVLTGLIAGLWAQSLASGRREGDLGFQAACLGAWLHGRAGEIAEKNKTAWAMTAGDVVESLPEAFQALVGIPT